MSGLFARLTRNSDKDRAHEQVSTRTVFFIIGVGGTAWVPLVPFARSRNGLNDEQLGLLLLCLGTGSMLAMPIAGILTAWFGCRRVPVVVSALIGLNLPLLANATDLPQLVAALFMFSTGISCGPVRQKWCWRQG